MVGGVVHLGMGGVQLDEAGAAIRGLGPQLALEGHVAEPELGLLRRVEEGELGLHVLVVLLRHRVLAALQRLVATLEVGAGLAGVVRLAEVPVAGEQTTGRKDGEGGEAGGAGGGASKGSNTLPRPFHPFQPREQPLEGTSDYSDFRYWTRSDTSPELSPSERRSL